MKNVDNFKELDQNKTPKTRPVPNFDHDRLNPDFVHNPIDPNEISESDKEIANREIPE